MKSQLIDDWLVQLEDLADHCVGALEEEMPQLLRMMHSLCNDGPPALCASFAASKMTTGELEKLIACGAYESAALRFIRGLGYMLSASPRRLVLASIVTGDGEESTFDANSETAALLGAAAIALTRSAHAR